MKTFVLVIILAGSTTTIPGYKTLLECQTAARYAEGKTFCIPAPKR